MAIEHFSRPDVTRDDDVTVIDTDEEMREKCLHLSAAPSSGVSTESSSSISLTFIPLLSCGNSSDLLLEGNIGSALREEIHPLRQSDHLKPLTCLINLSKTIKNILSRKSGSNLTGVQTALFQFWFLLFRLLPASSS